MNLNIVLIELWLIYVKWDMLFYFLVCFFFFFEAFTEKPSFVLDFFPKRLKAYLWVWRGKKRCNRLEGVRDLFHGGESG